ncbi:MAG: Asp-tRNA(Asn)/Glu-tRNA(Gln) amidotransferase GatCAB subunit C [Hydrogenothermus sp.]|nr:MAG: Asp-tRNA(Asn)/Glu-tRNA(Gln) amidotransferase GatCAB subunit C [Hydrogenothermus sp.]
MLTKEEVVKVAKLARIELSEEEIEIFSKQLPQILDFIEKLNELDTSEVSPFYEIIDANAPLREDTPKEGLTNEEALENAPQKANGFFVVPRVVKAE